MIQPWVRSTRARQITAPGRAVPDGHAVLGALARDESLTGRRPARARVALIRADHDPGMHGRRAHADHRDLRVAWTTDGVAPLVMPWQEPRDSALDAAPAG